MWTKLFSNPANSPSSRSPRYRQRATVTGIDHGAATVLLDSRSEQFYSLDETGRQIWSLMATPQTQGEIVATIGARFGVSEDQVSPDVAEFLAELERIKLIEVM
jgi:hypothetical protein